MLTVSNTSPILNLAIIEHLNLLPQQFEEVWIPSCVLGILLSAYKAKQLSLPMAAILDMLQEKAGFRLAGSLVQTILQDCGEGS